MKDEEALEMSDDQLKHVGTKRHSGRYPWGSGDDAFQGSKFLREYDELRSQKLTPTQIAEKMGMNTTQLRTNITWANKELRAYKEETVERLKAAGLSDREISEKTGMSERSVQTYKSPREKHEGKQLESVQKALEDGVKANKYLDVGIGVELQIQVPRTKFNAVVNKMVEKDGYYVHKIYVDRLNDPDKPTTLKVLTKEPSMEVVRDHSSEIRPLAAWSSDRGETISNINTPVGVDPKRVKIRYAEEGGKGKDGVIEMRPGVDDLDMGAAHYAQVRIKVGEDRFLKGMAVYGEKKDFPDGVDIIFNTNKSKEVPFRDVLKKTKEDMGKGKYGDNIFGGAISSQNKSNVINIVNQEGEWDTWSTHLSAQFLSKQPLKLIQERLAATHNALRKDLDEISVIDNPVVKEKLLEDYSKGLNSKAKKLAAQGLPKTKSHVILPFPDMDPDQVYAPHYDDGTRLVLVRYPHGGTFELPEVIVNNKNPKAKKMLGPSAPDAIGIHPSVAEKLSGADFDGDTVYAIPNNDRKIKTSRTLKELKNFDPMSYKVDHKTISPDYKQRQMGLASNLITDMTLKGASQSEIANAVRHSMVVIDSEKHNLDWKRSAREHQIPALKKKYQLHIDPDTGKPSMGASTLISRSKKKVILDPNDKNYDPNFDPAKYSSGTEKEEQYVNHIRNIQKLKKEADTKASTITYPKYDKDAARMYKPELDTLNAKLIEAKLNAPRERQAQLLSNKLYYTNLDYNMSKDQKKKLKQRSLARARATVGARGNEVTVHVTPREWEAIQAKAITTTKLKEVLRYSDMEVIRKYASPRPPKLSTAKMERARMLLDSGHTYAEVSQSLGITVTSADINPKK